MSRKVIRLPREFKKYFWDVDFKKLSLKKYSDFILARVMKYGDFKAFRWLLQFPKSKILKIIRTYRDLDAKTKNFWSLVYG